MNIACSFPGKFGDLLWALPTVRAISETYDEPVNLILSSYLRPIVPLIAEQPYIDHVVAYEPWHVQMTAPLSPRVPSDEFEFDRIFHLGYDGWPLHDLPNETHLRARTQFKEEVDPLDLSRPWITVQGSGAPCELAVGFTDEWFELKVGLVTLLELDLCAGLVLAPGGSRWHTERPTASYPLHVCDWLEAARVIRNSDRFLGCCSALHVLACAMGKPTIVVEPNEHRWHPIFHPEAVRDRVHLVHGTDGRPTFDARHVRAELGKFTRA